MSKSENKLVNVEGLKVKDGKPQHLVVGHVYAVTPEKAEIFIKTKQAVKTSKPVTKKTPAPVLGGKEIKKEEAKTPAADKAPDVDTKAGKPEEEDLTK